MPRDVLLFLVGALVLGVCVALLLHSKHFI